MEPPLVTFVLMAYNQEDYIQQAVGAAFQQDYSPLEIILSDDCSTDSTFDHLESLAQNYTGRHDLVINRNSVNRGLARHFSELVSKARGDVIVVAAGDDVSLPDRVTKTMELLHQYPEASVVSFSDVVIDANGKTIGRRGTLRGSDSAIVHLQQYLSGKVKHLSGASRGFRKDVFDIFGDLNPACPTEDTPFLLRCLMIGPGVISPEPGIFYRRHGANLSAAPSMQTMSVNEICSQHRSDLERAMSKGIVTQDQAAQVQMWIDRTLNRRGLAADFAGSNNKWEFYFKRVLPCQDYSFREKLGLARILLK